MHELKFKSKKIKVLITGSTGQLGFYLKRMFEKEYEVNSLDRSRLDLSRPNEIRAEIRSYSPDLIINAGAYTNVTLAESEKKIAYQVNFIAPAILAEESRKKKIPLIHYSTDYIFNGRKKTPYTEKDNPHPLNLYGRSKLLGELAIESSGAEYLILRVSWLYSNRRNNFFLKIAKLLKEREYVYVVSDEVGTPTWTKSVAQSTFRLAQRWHSGKGGPWGKYCMTPSGNTSWYNFAKVIREHLISIGQQPCGKLVPIRSKFFHSESSVKRPANSCLDSSLLVYEWDFFQSEWLKDFEKFLKEAV